MNNMLTVLQAYRAMQFFLEDYYNKTLSNDLGSLLGDMQLFPDGGTFDPAVWDEWLNSVGDKKKLTIAESFSAMQGFLNLYCGYINSDEVKALLDMLQPSDRIIWSKWKAAVQESLKSK